MEDLLKEIRKWFAYSPGGGQSSYQLKTLGTEYPAWVVRLEHDCYGVAIPYDGAVINESFNEVHFFSDIKIVGDNERGLLFLVSKGEASRETFAFFCLSLVNPGENGESRAKIKSNPLEWWRDWKTLVGNINVEKKPYAVLGELLVFQELLARGEKTKWNGPHGASKDISIPKISFEVKSTTSRYGYSIIIAGQFQLDTPGESSYLVFNRFEETENGDSINSVLSTLVSQYDQSESSLNEMLSKLGYPSGSSARNIRYSLIEQKYYPIDGSFPRITPASFKNDRIPDGITKIEYTVNLSICHSVSLERILSE